MEHYQHLCSEERFYIWNASREGDTQHAIANLNSYTRGGISVVPSPSELK